MRGVYWQEIDIFCSRGGAPLRLGGTWTHRRVSTNRVTSGRGFRPTGLVTREAIYTIPSVNSTTHEIMHSHAGRFPNCESGHTYVGRPREVAWRPSSQGGTNSQRVPTSVWIAVYIDYRRQTTKCQHVELSRRWRAGYELCSSNL